MNPDLLGDWVWRRSFMVVVTAFCMFCIVYVMVYGSTGGVPESIVQMAFGTIASVTGFYVAGRTWQDVSAMRNRSSGYYEYRGSSSRGIDDPDGGAS